MEKERDRDADILKEVLDLLVVNNLLLMIFDNRKVETVPILFDLSVICDYFNRTF